MPGKGRPFQKGQSGNPAGAPRVPVDIKKARSLTRTELERILNRYLHMTPAELYEAQQKPTTSALQHVVIAIVVAAVKDGDQKRLDFLLDRLIGKVPIKTDNAHSFNFATLSRAEVLALGKEAVAYLEQEQEQDGDGDAD